MPKHDTTFAEYRIRVMTSDDAPSDDLDTLCDEVETYLRESVQTAFVVMLHHSDAEATIEIDTVQT